ncbi:hypothetical protein FOVG_19316 [Fusarium oxysporum f. sp. pisi HDV247]|uniref:Uncharacterized protein n=1 Tax=Fusarium oxysporum f. sp. pisi HDV247 TaxID=1080344 RepID=W9N8Q4_FUSOX|nr:hypothetical protein FOVG_19316 [Fusarium oxysporum f. sp. pisi HDV247]
MKPIVGGCTSFWITLSRPWVTYSPLKVSRTILRHSPRKSTMFFTRRGASTLILPHQTITIRPATILDSTSILVTPSEPM